MSAFEEVEVVITEEGFFDNEYDKTIIEAGSFFCSACLVGKPAVEQSPDSRYCQGCYEFLLKEAEMLDSGKRCRWIGY